MLRGKMANGKNAKKATTTNQTNYFAHMRKNQKAKKNCEKSTAPTKNWQHSQNNNKIAKTIMCKKPKFCKCIREWDETAEAARRRTAVWKKSQKDSKKPQKQQNTIHRMSQFANDERAKESRKLMFFCQKTTWEQNERTSEQTYSSTWLWNSQLANKNKNKK